MFEIIALALAAPPAVLGVMDTAHRIRVWWDDRAAEEDLRKNPISDDEEQRFYVKSTHAKYMMGEDSSELIKVREIRVLRDVNKIRLDLVPVHILDAGASQRDVLKQEFYSIPGVALKRGKYYQVDLDADQVFKAKGDYTYLIGFKLRENINKIHENPEEDFIQIQRPLGRDEFVMEVHFPRTRKLTKINQKAQIKVLEVRRTSDGEQPPLEEEIDESRYTINTDAPIQAIEGIETDMFRLTLPNPPPDADVRVQWRWSKVSTKV